jgi:hypothetical protein
MKGPWVEDSRYYEVTSPSKMVNHFQEDFEKFNPKKFQNYQFMKLNLLRRCYFKVIKKDGLLQPALVCRQTE